jgi:hypothetical protein
LEPDQFILFFLKKTLNHISPFFFYSRPSSRCNFLSRSPSLKLESWNNLVSRLPRPFSISLFPVARHFKPHLNLLLFSFSFCQSWILLLEQGRVRLRVQFWRHTFMQEWLIHLSFSLSCKGYYSEGVLILNLLLRWMNIIFHREKNIYLACSKAPRYD